MKGNRYFAIKLTESIHKTNRNFFNCINCDSKQLKIEIEISKKIHARG